MSTTGFAGPGEDSPLAAAATGLAAAHLQPAILNHSIRTYRHALCVAAESLVTDYAGEELWIACLLHDLGTAPAYDAGQRFEVDGADGARRLLAEWGMPPDAQRRVWEAIALHTSPGIAERMGPLTRLTRAGVVRDFQVPRPPAGAQLEAELPRLDIDRRLADAVVAQALRNPAKAPAASWPAALLAGHRAHPDAERNPAV